VGVFSPCGIFFSDILGGLPDDKHLVHDVKKVKKVKKS